MEDYLEKAGKSPVEQREAKNNVNSTLRNAKGLFSKKVVSKLNLNLPFNSPFEAVTFEPRQNTRYRSEIDVAQIMDWAKNGSTEQSISPLPREQWKIFLLAVMTGLRRKEIDLLEWSAIRFSENVVRIEATDWFSAKSEDSYQDVHVGSAFMEVMEQFYNEDKEKGPFVIQSKAEPKLDPTTSYYRCNYTFRKLIQWLRKAGINNREPLHTLRKEFGSQINAEHVIYAAQQQLRHAEIALTTSVYVAPRSNIASTRLAGLLDCG